MTKVYYVKSIHNGRETIWEGTLEYLKERVFGYTQMWSFMESKDQQQPKDN